MVLIEVKDLPRPISGVAILLKPSRESVDPSLFVLGARCDSIIKYVSGFIIDLQGGRS